MHHLDVIVRTQRHRVALSSQTISPGEPAFCEEDHGDAFYIVLRGTMLLTSGAGGSKIVLELKCGATSYQHSQYNRKENRAPTYPPVLPPQCLLGRYFASTRRLTIMIPRIALSVPYICILRVL